MSAQATFDWARPTKDLVRKDIPPSQISLPKEYEREDSLVEDDVLLKSVEKAKGIQQPIIVIQTGDSRYTVVKGGRRLRVAALLNHETIPAVVHTPPKGANVKGYRDRLRFVLSHLRQDLIPSERAKLITDMMRKFQLTQKDIATMSGYDAGTITNWLSVNRYAKPIGGSA